MSANSSSAFWRVPATREHLRSRRVLHRLIVLLLWGLVGLGAMEMVLILKTYDRATNEDFAVYYLEAQEMHHGLNPYTSVFTQAARSDGLHTNGVTHGSDPPTFLVFLMEPLSELPIRTAYWLWQAANLACLIAALYLLIGPGSGLESSLALPLIVLVVFYPPVLSHFWFGQSKIPVLLLLVMTMRWLEKSRDGLAGIALAVATLLRFFPLVVFAYLVLQQRWRAFGFALAGLVIGAGLTLAATGLENCASFLPAAFGLVHDSANNTRKDLALYFLFYNNIGGFHLLSGLRLNLASHLLTFVGDTIIMAATVIATLMLPAGKDPGSRLLGLWVATSILLLPVAWDYDLTVMLIPFAQLAIAADRREVSGRAIAMVVVSYLAMLWWEFVAHGAHEGGCIAMLAAYLGAFWLATDQPECVPVPIHSLQTHLLRRVAALRGEF